MGMGIQDWGRKRVVVRERASQPVKQGPSTQVRSSGQRRGKWDVSRVQALRTARAFNSSAAFVIFIYAGGGINPSRDEFCVFISLLNDYSTLVVMLLNTSHRQPASQPSPSHQMTPRVAELH